MISRREFLKMISALPGIAAFQREAVLNALAKDATLLDSNSGIESKVARFLKDETAFFFISQAEMSRNENEMPDISMTLTHETRHLRIDVDCLISRSGNEDTVSLDDLMEFCDVEKETVKDALLNRHPIKRGNVNAYIHSWDETYL